MILRDRADKTTPRNTLSRAAYAESNTDDVLLDGWGPDQDAKRTAFISTKQGTPCLQIIATHYTGEGSLTGHGGWDKLTSCSASEYSTLEWASTSTRAS
jgi:hypothetical protein